MRKWILIFIPLFIWSHSLVAQDVVGCTQLLEDAREAYTAGMVELVPELLLSCLEPGGLTGTLRQDAYKLVVSAYLFDYLPEEADSLMNDFVNDFPDYRATDSDPAEFALLLDSHLRAIGIDPSEELVTEEKVIVPADGGLTSDSRTRIRAPFVYGNSMGFIVGSNITFPQIIERYSIGDPTQDDGSYSIAPGFQVGAAMNFLLSDRFEASFGIQYYRSRFKFTSSPISFSTYEYEESQDHLQIPVSMIVKLNPESTGASIYLRVGFVGDYLLGASGTGTRSYTESLKDVVVEKMTIKDSRARMNLHGMAGVGVRIPLDHAFLFFETRFTYGLFLVNNAENRYDNQDLTWLIYHVDSDFRSHQLSLSAGVAWNLKNP